MGALLLKFRTWWETADRTARVVTLFGSAFLILLLGGTFYFASKPKMTLAYGGLAPAEVGEIVAEIQKMGVPVDSDIAGNIYVPNNKLPEVRAKIASSGKQPGTTHLGNDDMAKLNAMTTPAVERERLKAILEGELAKSIETMEGVNTARVHITLGERTAFASEKQPPSAAIYLQSKGDYSIGPEQAKAIATLVSRSVPGLSLEQVFVTDTGGRALFDGTSNSSAGAQANMKLAAEITEAQRRERDLQNTFDGIFGRGNTMVKVNLSMDFDQATIRSHTVKTSKTPEVADTFLEEVSDTSASGSAEVGLSANTPGSNAPASNEAKKGYTGKQESLIYPKSTIDETKEKAVGGITKMAISVMVNKDKADPEAVQNFCESYIAAYPGATATVTEVEFDQTQAEEMKKAAAAAASQTKMSQLFSLLPLGGLIVAAFFILKGISKAMRSQNVLVTALPGGGVLPTGGLPYGPTGESAPIETENAEDAAALVAATEQQSEDSFTYENEEETPEIRAIRERINVPLEQIKKMAHERPEAVAMLLKSWLLEERR
jgi:flagellar M-ring protein FliF